MVVIVSSVQVILFESGFAVFVKFNTTFVPPVYSLILSTDDARLIVTFVPEVVVTSVVGPEYNSQTADEAAVIL